MRQVILVLSAVCLAVAVALFLAGMGGWWLVWLILQGSILLLSLLFERWCYRPQINRHRGNWQRTGERFVDPGTGRLTEVLYNPETGERDYVAVDGGK